MKKLLLLEDDPILGTGLQVLFQLEGFIVSWAKTIKEAMEVFKVDQFDMAILDVGLPDGSGIDFCKWLRDEKYPNGIIILTAQTDEESTIKGLMSGADDYVKKPFSNKELIARIQVNLRQETKKQKIIIGKTVIDLEHIKIVYDNKEINLKRKEFDVLVYFAKKPEAIITRDMIIENALENIEVNDRTVDSHISHIRSKLQKAGCSDFVIKSEYGIGYRMETNC